MRKLIAIVTLFMTMMVSVFAGEWTTKETAAERVQEYEAVNTRQFDTADYYKKIFKSSKKASYMVNIAKEKVKAGKPSQIIYFDNGDILVLTFADEGKTMEETCYTKTNIVWQK